MVRGVSTAKLYVIDVSYVASTAALEYLSSNFPLLVVVDSTVTMASTRNTFVLITG